VLVKHTNNPIWCNLIHIFNDCKIAVVTKLMFIDCNDIVNKVFIKFNKTALVS